MKYPSPRAILTNLSTRGPSGVQAEAIDLLLTDLPERWPNFERGSREALLRRLAANKKKSAKTRLSAVKEVLGLLNVETKPKAQEIDAELRALLSGEPLPSTKAHEVETRGRSPVPESAVSKSPAPSLPVPADDVQDVQKADAQKADDVLVESLWFPPLKDPNADAAALLIAKLARQRNAEAFNVAQWAEMSLGLARQREKKPKTPRLMIGGPGGELCD